jgi:hypothetical protein
MSAMQKFVEKHKQKVTGTISIFDRIIFKGYLPFGFPEAMEKFLYRNGFLIKDFKLFAKDQSEFLKQNAMEYAKRQGRPYQYLNEKMRKEELARQIAERDGINEGLICVFSVVEQNSSFAMRYGENKPRLVSSRPRCLTLYFYFMDRQLGFMHVRLSTWLPFMIQVYINGHEWLARKLDKDGIRYNQLENAFLSIEDCTKAQKIADKFPKQRWEKILASFARRINPLLKTRLKSMEYYWVTDQAEYATDIMFKNPASLSPLNKKLQRHSTVCFSAEDILTFLGRKLNGHFKGEVENDYKKRLPGARVKHRMKGNGIKMYDKFGSVLRVETVINRPYEFKIRRHGKRNGQTVLGWFPMAKRVTNLYRYAEVSKAANRQYLDALSVIDDPEAAFKMIDKLCSPAELNGKRKRALNPVSPSDVKLFVSVMRGEHCIHGFRNGELAEHLGMVKSKDKTERRRQSSRICRMLQILRAHRLIAKVPRSRRYRVTLKGFKLMTAAIFLREEYMPKYILA